MWKCQVCKTKFKDDEGVCYCGGTLKMGVD